MRRLDNACAFSVLLLLWIQVREAARGQALWGEDEGTMFRSKQRQIQSRLAAYRDKTAECVSEFKRSLGEFCHTGDRGQLEENVAKVHHLESAADDIRREVEVMMYSKALFPESRGDVLGLLETMDRVPNKAESVLRLLLNQHVAIPDDLHEPLLHLADVCCQCVEAMLDASARVFTDFASATAIIGKVDQLESDADAIEASLLQAIFSGGLPDLRKILLRDLVETVSAIADRSEVVGDRIRIIVAKRLV